MKQQINQLVKASQSVGQYHDLVQGGGGNTSVKINDHLMAVKASGYELADLTSNKGFTIVNHQEISRYFQQIDLAQLDVQSDEASVTFVKSQVQTIEDFPSLRPSMETGFHAILDNFVIHTHSVYSNIINCAQSGQQLLTTIFGETNIQPVWINYKSPGFYLTLEIREAIKSFQQQNGKAPQVFFLKNHGLITTAPNVETCIQLDQQVNQIIQTFFALNPAHYPVIELTKHTDETYISQSSYLRDFFQHNQVDEKFFERILFPDQTVFFQGNFNFTNSNQILNKININPKTGSIIYKTHYKEAKTIEATLLAYLYILEQIDINQLTPDFINAQDVDYINNMESEKYRKNLLKN